MIHDGGITLYIFFSFASAPSQPPSPMSPPPIQEPAPPPYSYQLINARPLKKMWWTDWQADSSWASSRPCSSRSCRLGAPSKVDTIQLVIYWPLRVKTIGDIYFAKCYMSWGKNLKQRNKWLILLRIRPKIEKIKYQLLYNFFSSD